MSNYKSTVTIALESQIKQSRDKDRRVGRAIQDLKKTGLKGKELEDYMTEMGRVCQSYFFALPKAVPMSSKPLGEYVILELFGDCACGPEDGCHVCCHPSGVPRQIQQ